MYKKLITSLLVLTLINYLVSCHTTEKVPSEQVFMMDEKIVAAVMTDGDVINFDDNGGLYHLLESVIVGTSIEDEKITVPLLSVLELRKSRVASVSLDDVGTKKITEIVSINNRLFEFNNEGGKYNKQENVITGTTIDGTSRNIKPEQILEIHLELPETISKEEIIKNDSLFISQIVLENSNLLMTFDDNGAKYFQQMAVVSGTTLNGNPVNLNPSEILYVKVERTDVGLTILASLGVIVGILATLVVIAAATKQSCPFVYSHDSTQYVFDAEPLGGAVTKGLQRTDLSKLDHLKEVDGKYKLLVRNEVPETQHIDEMSLYVVDHPKGTQVITDLKGNFHTINHLQKPISAKDENGMDLTAFVEENDYNFWQTKLPITDFKSNGSLKHQLTFVFPKPADKKKAKLIINAGTALWGSQMIREMLSMYGDQVDDWYDKVDNMNGTEVEKDQMMQFVVREELYYLNIFINENNSWNSQGLIFGGGPLIAETKTYPLNLENVVGDSLVIRFNPPYGFWTLDYISVEYEDNYELSTKELKISKAVDNNDRDIIKSIYTIDDEYYSMPEVGDYYLVEFDALPESGGMDRSYFLKTTGYYELHLNKDKPMQKELLYEIVNERGKVVEYAMKLYNQWIVTAK